MLANPNLRPRALAAVATLCLVLTACDLDVPRSPDANQRVPVPTTAASEETAPPASEPARATPATRPPTKSVSDRASGADIYLIGDASALEAVQRPGIPTDPTAMVEALLDGPTPDEVDAGLTTAIPAGTSLHGVRVAERRAEVNLSESFATPAERSALSARLAQLTRTVTALDGIESVVLRIDAERVRLLGDGAVVVPDLLTPAALAEPAPPIIVDTPRNGDTLASPQRVRGLANTYESTVVVRVVDDAGRTLALESATADASIDRWGPFEVDLRFDPIGARSGSVVVFEESAADGAELHKVTIPVAFAPFDDGD